jgi:hypothetical protein
MTEPNIAMCPIVDQATLEDALERGREALTRDGLGPLSRLSWPLVRATLAKAIEDALCACLPSWLAEGWSGARELHALKDEEGKDGGPALFKLGKHEMKGALHPVVTLSCGGASLPPIIFDIILAATVNPTSLAIRKGHIVGLGGGECDITVQIEYDGNDLTGALPVATIALPGAHDFDPPGIPIP